MIFRQKVLMGVPDRSGAAITFTLEGRLKANVQEWRWQREDGVFQLIEEAFDWFIDNNLVSVAHVAVIMEQSKVLLENA